MGLEVTSTINGLDESWPLSGDSLSAQDDHTRLLKAVLKNIFAGSTGNGFSIPITANEAELNILDGVTALAAEINALDLTTGAGTAEALKALVLDASKDIDGINSLTAALLVGSLTGNVTGNLAGNVTGNCSGSSGSCTGNSATATNAGTVTTITTTQALAAIAGGTAGDLGSYAWLGETAQVTREAGASRAGSNLRYAGYTTVISHASDLSGGLTGVGNGGTPLGSWIAMGRSYSSGSTYPATLWLRVL